MLMKKIMLTFRCALFSLCVVSLSSSCATSSKGDPSFLSMFNELSEVSPSLLQGLDWVYFPEDYSELLAVRAEMKEVYGSEISANYNSIEEISVFNDKFLVGAFRHKNCIFIKHNTEDGRLFAFPTPYYVHSTIAKEWSSSGGDYLLVYVDLKATKNLSILFVFDAEMNIVSTSEFVRGIGLGVGGDGIFAVKHRPNNTRYFELRD